MKITPHVNLLRSLRGERVDYVLLVGEGVDNAFDAGATKIDITINSDEVTFKDDGIGIRRDKVASVFSLGDHGHMSSTKLGRFGVGIKSQAINAGDTFYVESVSEDGRFFIEVQWDKVLRSGDWNIEDPRWRPAAVGTPTGTIISISDLRKSSSLSFDKMAFEIALRFHPAIAVGKQIILNDHRVDLLPEPALTDVIERTIQLGNGKTASVRGGLLTQPSKLHHVHVGYEHRVIMPECSLGCKQYSGLNKMFARVQLYGRWRLAKFKNDLPDYAEREELEEAVAEVLRPILEKCSSASLSAKIIQLSNDLNEMIPEEFSAARPRREREKEPGPKKKRKPGLVDKDKSNPDGPAKSKRPPDDKFIITFDGIAIEDGVGTFQSGRPHRVNLSKDDPYISMLMEHRDQKVGLKALYAKAIAIFVEGLQSYKATAQYEMQLEGTFGQRISKLLSLQESADEALTA